MLADQDVLILKAPIKLNASGIPYIIKRLQPMMDYIKEWSKLDNTVYLTDQAAEEVDAEISTLLQNLGTSPLAHLENVDEFFDIQHLDIDLPVFLNELVSTWPPRGVVVHSDPDSPSDTIILVGCNDFDMTDSYDGRLVLQRIMDFNIGQYLNIR